MESKKYGLHTPESTTKYLNILNKDSLIKFKDVSWGNDLTDSAYNEEKDIQVFFPNSTEDSSDEEKFNHFLVICNRETAAKKEVEFQFATIEEVIIKLNSN